MTTGSTRIGKTLIVWGTKVLDAGETQYFVSRENQIPVPFPEPFLATPAVFFDFYPAATVVARVIYPTGMALGLKLEEPTKPTTVSYMAIGAWDEQNP
jgi:hypothetical protein